MDDAKWQRHLLGAHNPPSLTSADPARIAETKAGIKHAVRATPPDAKILVLGCGDGTELAHLAELGFHNPIGVTFHDEEHERSQFAGMVNADGHDLPFEAGTFDMTYSKEYLEHLIAPFIGVYEIARVTKLGGAFCHFISIGLDKQREPYHFSSFPAYCWVDLFHKAGLEVHSWRKVEIYGDAEIQIVLEGVKATERSLDDAVEGYDLRSLTNRTHGSDLVLMRLPRPQ